jgi:DNA-binding MarR family transcriptional regulator
MTTAREIQTNQPQGSSVVEPIEEVTYTLLIKTASRLEGELNRLLRGMELTSATYSILRILESAGPNGRSCGDISEQLIAEVPDMTRLLDRLERLGYCSRERSSVDRRMVKVSITEKGREALRALGDTVKNFHVRQLGHLGGAKLSELGTLLAIILNQPPGRLRVTSEGNASSH